MYCRAQAAVSLSATVLLLLSGATGAQAQPRHAEPGSVLIFPLFDARDNHGTILTVTNRNLSRRGCSGGFTQGDVLLHFLFFGFDENRRRCNEFDDVQQLTPGDTITKIASHIDPENDAGWLWVEAEDPITGDPIEFNYLIGSAVAVDEVDHVMFGYTPFVFRGLPDQPGDGAGLTPCGHRITDLDGDGRADFDGQEYDFFPRTLLLDSFLEEGNGNPRFRSELVLLSTNFDRPTQLAFGIWNNREQRFSRSMSIDCFFRDSLRAVSSVVTNLGGDPNEIIRKGQRAAQAGWLEVSGDHGILGVFMQQVEGECFSQGRELQFEGQFGGPDDPLHDPVEIAR
jgi:hypothetical protein